MLTVYIDFKSPSAFLAMRPTLTLADHYKLTIDWRPFRTVERDVPKLGQAETVGESHRRVRAAALRAQAVKYAKHQGIDLRFPEVLGNTDLALGVLSSLEGEAARSFIEAAFAAYWHDHLDLNDLAVVQGLITASGRSLVVDELATRARLDAALAHADDVGIVGAPAYVIANQIFVGREHLPWIEEIIVNARAAPV